MNRKERRAAGKAAAGNTRLPGTRAAELVAAAARYFHAGQMSAAEHACRETLRFDPNHFDAMHLLGVIATRLGRNSAAVDLLRRAIALNDRNAECHFHLGWALAALGRLDESTAPFTRALDLNPTFVHARYCLANALREQGKLDDAAEQFRRTLALKPDHVAAHYDLGAVLVTQGNLDDAVAHFQKALIFEPSSTAILNDLAVATERQGKLADALEIFQRAMTLKPGDAIPQYNVGRVLFLLGRFDQARMRLERALALKPDFLEAYNTLNNTLRKLGKLMEALACAERALAINPGYTGTQLNLCATLYELHVADRDAAAAQAARLLKAHGNRPLIRRGLAGIVGVEIDAHYDGAYARSVFDDFSRTFDRTLTALGYSPRAIAQALAIDASQRLDILDAGCGTGLAGTLFKPVARSLVGLDISPGMLEQARALAIYDRLVCTDVAAFMSRSPDTFDLIVAADVLPYIGDLSCFLDAAYRALRPDGRLAVSAECLDREGQTEGYRLAASGRYKHSRRYLEQAFSAAGFTIDTIAENSLRRELDQTIQAWIVLGGKRRQTHGRS